MNRGERIVQTALDRAGLEGTPKNRCHESEAGVRLRRETVMTLYWIAERLHMGFRPALAKSFRAAQIPIAGDPFTIPQVELSNSQD